ncbi:ribonuclease P protein component [Candidatus Saccharibacteria bacterium]|nr:MAG: ribonuclease P protein component [Candidatus Saccharibacteria bacterium]
MLASNHRFRGSRDIQRLYKHGAGSRTRLLGLRYRTETDQLFRAAVVVSKKVHKSAVVRNRIRRRLYELLRTDYGVHLKGVELLITVFDASLATMSAKSLKRELANLLSKAQASGRPKTNRGIVEDKGE